MKKKVIVSSVIIAITAVIVYCLISFRYTARNISIMQQLEIERMFLSDPAFNLGYIRYYEDTQNFEI